MRVNKIRLFSPKSICKVGNGLWFMYRSCSRLVWAIILHMIIIILLCPLIMAISQGMFARWSGLICVCKDHSTEVVLSLRRGGRHIQMKNKLEKTLICHRLIRPLLFAPPGALQGHGKDTEGLREAQHHLFTFKQSMLSIFDSPMYTIDQQHIITVIGILIFAFTPWIHFAMNNTQCMLLNEKSLEALESYTINRRAGVGHQHWKQ